MNETPTSAGRESGRALYVYGVVPGDSPSEVFAGVPGVDASGPILLVAAGKLAAIASAVPLEEYGEAAIESNLRDPTWLEEKVRAHDRVLEAAVGRTTVVPFRFGAIYRGEEQVRRLLSASPHFVDTLARLRGTVEFGVKAFLDRESLRGRLAADRGIEAESPTSGRGYMQRRQLDRELDDAVRSLTAECVRESHERLEASAVDGRMNPLPRPELTGDDREMVMNAAYLVQTDDADRFRRALSALEASYADRITYELTGPWPPYNFAEDAET
jgi:hypothetical protein